MADIKTNQSKVYNALKGMGFSGIGASEQEFAAKMSNPKNRAKVYKALSERGYKGIGKDQAAFDTLIYKATATAEPQPTQTPAGKTAGTVAQPSQHKPTQQPAVQPQKLQQPKQGYKPTDMEMMGFGMTINSAQGAVDSAKESLDRTIQNQETFRKQQPLGGGVAKSAPKFNAETGQMEQTYITSAGTEHTDKNQAEDIQRRLRDAAWRESHPLEAAERENTQDMRDIRMEEERLTEARRKSDEHDGEGWWETFKRNLGASLVTGMAPMGSNVDRDMVEAEMTRYGAYGAERQGIAREQDKLLARRRLAEETQQLLADVRRDREIKGIGSGLLRAGSKVLETALNPRTWDFGEADMASQFAVADAVMKADSGLGLSSNEQKLLDTWAKNAAINSQFADQLSGWTKAGIVTGESLPFMLEMAMNPASGLGEAATAQLMKYSLKKYGTKWVKDHAKSMLAKKIATRLIGDVVGAGVMANTTGLARVAADAQSRMTGQVDIQLDPNGNVIYKGVKDAESPGAAIFKAMASTSIENWSEMAGNYLGFVNSFFGKALGKSVVGKAGRKMLAETGSIEGVSLNKAQKFIYELAAGKGIGAFNQGLAQFAKRTQWHGVIGEYLEEEIGNIANAAIVGDMTFDTKEGTGVFNLQQNIDTFCGVALMGGFMSALNTVGYVGHRINYDVDRVSNANAQLFGDDLWRRIRTTIDSSVSDPRGLNDTLTDLIRGDGGMFDENGKKAILKYTQAALEKQGAEMAQYQPRMASSSRRKSDEHGGWEVSSMDKNGDVIETQAFETEDEAKAYEGELKMNQQWQDYRDNLSMTNKLSYPEAAQAVDEFIRGLGDGFDYAETVAAINDPKSELGKRFLQFKTEKILQKAEANRQAIEAFEEENGWTPGTVQWLSEQDPMQLDAEGLAMADQARDFIEGLAYPAGEVHVEHEQQLGADTAQAVVENVISTEEPIDPNNNAGQQLMDAYKASLNNMTALFDRNEEIKEEFSRLLGMGLSPQEIISSLDSFRPEDVQTIIDWYNANARYQSFMDEASRQIDRVAHSNRERRTFHGTINGNEDNQNVIVISDGTNSYTLVSGNVTMDGGGRITGTDSGLIIGLDENGDFVQLGDGSGYSVMPGAMSLDQWEEMERERLQQQVSLVVDPTGAQAAQEAAAQPQPTEQQAGNVGGEAGANTGTGADETPTPAPVAPTTPINPPSPSGEAAGTPAVSIESVKDKDGIKRYENGVGVDDAIADIQADGFDVGEVADASIGEAQAVVDKINGKATKTRKDLMDRKKAQSVIDYYQALKERWAAIVSQQTEPPANGEENVNNQPGQPGSGGNVVSSQAVGEIPAGNAAGTTATVEEQKQERIKALKAELGELFDDDFTKANDVYELVSMWIGRKRNLAWDDVNGKRGLQKELGWTRKIGGDTKYIETLLAKKGEGIGVDEFVHMVWESPENSVGEEKRWTTEEIKEALLDLLKSAQSKSDVVDYAVNNREQAARAALEAQQQMEQEAAAQQPAEVEVAPLTDEEIAQMEANLPFAAPVEGEDIPENPLTALWEVIREVSQDGNMPTIRLIDTDQMTDGDWLDLASQVYGGAFVDEETVASVRNYAMEAGAVYDEATDTVNIFSGAVTPETLREKLEQIKSEYNGREAEEGSSNEPLRDSNLEPAEAETPQGAGSETPAAAGAAGTEGQGSTEQEVDPYLQPRNEQEREIIAEIEKQLQQEIDAAIKARDKAANDLQKAQAKESERATDIFSDDEAFQEPGQLFSFDEMGGTDRTQEGVNRRTASERKAFEDAKNKVDQLQSVAERNSRIRGALDNERRQTSFVPEGEASGTTADPMEAIEHAAHQFKQEQEAKNAYGKDNKLVSQDRYEELKKKMKQKLLGQLNAGFDPEIISIGAEMAMFHVEAGARKFADFARRMIDDLGDAIRPYLQGIYESAKRMPGMQELRNEMDSTEVVDAFDVDNFDKEEPNNANEGGNSVNVNKQENNEPENVVSSQSGTSQGKPASTLTGDSAEFAERQQKIAQLSKKIRAKLQGIANWGDQPKPLSAYKQIAKELGIENLSDTDLQELIETEVVNLAREIANKEGLTDEKKFQKIVKLYEGQPSLNARDNDRINKQQYSTPAPMAFLMGRFVLPSEKRGAQRLKGLEPSAGNGMLTLNLPKEAMHVNDIDEMRLSNLAKQGFSEVTSQDGTLPFGEKQYDFVVTNPPFGSVPAKTYDGYTVTSLEQQMVLNALESMKDDGRAAIIIGGNTEYKPNGSISGKDKAFLNYLYSHYNVVDVINMDGKALYSRQGTGYNVRMILIKGRKQADNSFAPVKSKAKAEQVKSYDELYKRVNDDILSDSNKSAGVHDTESGESNGKHDNGHAGTATETGVRNVQPGRSEGEHNVLDTDGRGVRLPEQPTDAGERGGRGLDSDGQADSGLVSGTPVRDSLRGTETTEPNRGAASQTEPGGRGGRMASGRVDSERHTGGADLSSGGGSRGTGTAQPVQQPEPKRGLSTEKVPYKKQSSNPFTLDSLMPAEQADEVKKILEELGDVDQFLVDELGYSSKEELHQALAAEQIDSVAMAIHQMNQGNAFIIGDMTGIGKGRQAAALIRYAHKKGGCPVFVTVKKALFSDMYRDLCDIGSPGLRPFIWCAKDKDKSENITDADGNIVYKWNEKEQKRVVEYINKHGKLPPEYDYVVTTYDSFKSGTKDYEDGQKKDRKWGKDEKPGPSHRNGQAKRDAMEALAANSYVIMDESHNAGGDKSNVSKYLQYITTRTKGTTFLSATFAKRPENMPIYALRTAISKAGVKIDELISAVKQGGATFQEIMSKALTGAGQMIRRERDMTGVTIDWKGIDDEGIVEKQRQQYDTIVGLFNDIIDFQRRYVDPIVNDLNDEAADAQGEVDHTRGTRDMGINNTPFASRTYNMVQQVLLSLKAEEAGKRAVEHLKAGRKPVIAVANTNEGAADEAVGMSEEDLEMPDLSVNLKKGLQGTLRITRKDDKNKESNETIPFDRLSPEGQARYQEIMDAIENASSGLSLSPIDVIKNELKKAGYKVGELTGRKQEFVYNEDGTVRRVKRQDTDKKRTAADFNSGKLDALIINRSAGTGISLHASSKFKDQRQRIMIVAQAQGDVNDEVQMRGRIDRTGQVLRGMYEYVVSQIPSEQRLLMMLKAKLRSLDANTTSSQKSKFNEMQVQDIINKYGDDIVIQYLAEHTDLAAKMVDPLKWGEGFETMPAETLIANATKDGEAGKTASKVLGRMALLKVAEQEKMLAEIGDLYQAEIDRLNEMGENDLEITEMPLRAKTLGKKVWEEGVEPGGKNPFADNSYVEEVEMDILKKPMKAEEVKKSQARLLGVPAGEPAGTVAWENYKRGVMERLDAWEAEKKKDATDTITARAEKKAQAEKDKYIKGAKKAQEKNQMTDAEIEKNGQYQYDHFYKEEMEKLDKALEAVDKQKQAFVDALETFTTDGVYALPTDIYDLGQLSFEPSFGKVIDIKISDNFSTAASTISFATLDGRRKITIPISGMVKQSNGEKKDIKPIIVQQTAQARSGFFGSNVANMLKVLEQNVDNWDKLTSTATRKKGYIITGNLLKALTSLQKQGAGGKLISYTTDTGEIRQGVLMGDRFDPGALTSQNPISSAKADLNSWETNRKITSADGDVTIKADGYGSWMSYTLKVPKSKKKGEKYFNDKVLLSLMDGQFEGSSALKADFKEENLDKVLKRLDELGVTVQSKKEDSPKRMITTEDPIEAIRQAADDWRKENVKSSVSRKSREKADRLSELPKRFGLQGAAPTYTINSRDDLEALKGHVSRTAYNEIEELYNERDTGAAFVPRARMVVVFGEHLDNANEAEAAWWHEQTHGFWQSLPISLRRRYGEACLEYLRNRHKDIYNHIRREYPMSEWPEEACSFLIGNVVIEREGTERFLNDVFVGNEEIVNFATELRNYIKNGQQKGKGDDRSHQLRRTAGIQGRTEVYRTDSQGREWENSELRAEAESELSEDPIEAIEQSAKRWRIQRRDQENGSNTPESHSEKAVYDERLNRVETVFTEAYQDSMIALKTAQNAIAHDKAIPDSQNAYMAENLMHGKNKNEMDLFNKMLRDPLINTINKIMNATGMNWGDVDRYVYTKSGLERNREFFVRDWLERERNKNIKSYDELHPVAQGIYDWMANRIEKDFEDGIIGTEEEKQEKLEQAIQKAHQQWLDNIEREWNEQKSSLYADLMNEAITFADYLGELTTYIQDNIDGEYNPSENDYSGFRAMYGDENGKYNEDAIIDELMNTEDAIDEAPYGEPSGTVALLWEQINAATRYGLERYREAGMRSDEQIDRVEQMFHWYVPMRGFKEDKGEDMYQYFTGKDKAKNYVGGLLKHAKGRGSEANYPISTIFAMTYKAISDCNQNLVNQKLYRLCQANPNDLVVLSDSWARLNEQTGEWEEVAPEIGDDMDEEEIREETLRFEEEMRQLAADDKAQKIKGKEHFDYKPMDKKKKSEHIVDVRINGQQKRMIVVGNPRMAQALNGQLRYSEGDGIMARGRLTHKIQDLNRSFLSFRRAVSTNYSLNFVWRNAKRDWSHFSMLATAKEGAGYAKAAEKYYLQKLVGMRRLFKKYREGTLDENNEVERDFKDFMDNGGITGFVQMQKVDDIQKEFESLVKKMKKGGEVKLKKSFWDKILTAIEAYNEAIENRARFATYRASRHYAGRTKARSAYDAKEITANFNRRGAGKKTAGFKSESEKVMNAAYVFGRTSQVLNANRMFFNATVQAIATLGSGLREADGKTKAKFFGKQLVKRLAKYGSLPFLLGGLIPMLNQALIAVFGGGDDDDPYANLPEWVRRNNICIYIGNGNFFTFALGQELAAFYSLADIAAGLTYYPELKPVDKTVKDEIMGFLSVFSPVDMETKVTKDNKGQIESVVSEYIARVYSNAAPLIQVSENISWTGRPIYREDRFPGEEDIPEYKMTYSGTPKFYKLLSEGLNRLGGGDDVHRGGRILFGAVDSQINPGTMQYLVDQYFGGVGRLFINTGDAFGDGLRAAMGRDYEFNIRKVEGFRALFQQSDDRTQFYRAKVKYNKYKREADALEHDIKGYAEDAETNPDHYMKLMEKTQGVGAARLFRIKEYEDNYQLPEMRKAINSAEGKERRELQQFYNTIIKELVDELDAVPDSIKKQELQKGQVK